MVCRAAGQEMSVLQERTRTDRTGSEPSRRCVRPLLEVQELPTRMAQVDAKPPAPPHHTQDRGETERNCVGMCVHPSRLTKKARNASAEPEVRGKWTSTFGVPSNIAKPENTSNSPGARSVRSNRAKVEFASLRSKSEPSKRSEAASRQSREASMYVFALHSKENDNNKKKRKWTDKKREH